MVVVLNRIYFYNVTPPGSLCLDWGGSTLAFGSPMTEHTWSKRGLVNQAARDVRAARIPTTTTRAKFRTVCFHCDQLIQVGDGIAMVSFGGGATKRWRHATCALPSGPGKTTGST
jgi:hypothetical protein